jgi:SNF2 family DNA or RNA helicase
VPTVWLSFFFFFRRSYFSATLNEEEKKKKGQEVVSTLHKLLRPFILRRLKKEVDRYAWS